MTDDRFWLDRPTLVTGATGLVGGELVRALIERGADVTCIVRDGRPDSRLMRSGAVDRVKVVCGDICEQATMERALGEYEIDTVFHLAAQAIVPIANRNPVSTFESNIKGTWTVLEAARRSPLVRTIVTASSDKAYGTPDVLPYTEDFPLAAVHPYDVSKSCSDLIAQSYAATYGTRVAITRCGNFFGPGDLNWNRLIPGTIRSVLRGREPLLRSDGSSVRDYFFLDDGVLAYLTLAEQLARRDELVGQAFNFSYETPISALAVVQEILAVMDSSIEPVILGEASHEIPAQWLSAQKARLVLGWKPRYDFTTGLRRTIDWYAEQLGAPPNERILEKVLP